MIKEQFEISYSEGHVGYLLKAMNYSKQKPQGKDPRQDPAQVEAWKQKRVKKLRKQAKKQGRVLFYVDEASFFLTPTLWRTYAKKGQHPIIHTYDKSFKHIFACSGISPQGDFFYTINKQAYRGENIIEFIEQLLQQIPQTITIIWDGSPRDGASIHNCNMLKQYLETLPQGRLHLERLPSYSPALNADEQVWNYIKNVDLKNKVFKTLAQLKKALIENLEKFYDRTQLIQSFFYHQDVAFY